MSDYTQQYMQQAERELNASRTQRERRRKRTILFASILLPVGIVVLIGIGVALNFYVLAPSRAEERLRDQVEALGGTVTEIEGRSGHVTFNSDGSVAEDNTSVSRGLVIDLSDTEAGDEDLEEISKLCRTMARARQRKTVYLNCSGTQITVEGIACFSGIRTLASFNVSNTSVTWEDIKKYNSKIPITKRDSDNGSAGTDSHD